MDLHGWITQQVNAVEKRARACDATDWRHVFDGIIVDRDTDGWQSAPDRAVIARVDYDRIYWNCNPAHSPEADHIVSNDPDTVLLRCEADRRILAIHCSVNDGYTVACDGCGTAGICDDWITENINDCPILLAIAHAHGITPDVLAGLDRPQAPERSLPADAAYELRITSYPTRPLTTSDVPEALRGPNWKPRNA